MNNFNEDKQKKGATFEAAPPKPLNANNTSTNNQHQIILSALREQPQSTIALRHVYCIMMPAARINVARQLSCLVQRQLSCLVDAEIFTTVFA